MTKAETFLRANERSPVVYASVVTDPHWRGEGLPPSRGCYYRLQNGQTFKLGLRDVRAIGEPRWAFEEEYA
jgi:hypothetical protein